MAVFYFDYPGPRAPVSEKSPDALHIHEPTSGFRTDPFARYVRGMVLDQDEVDSIHPAPYNGPAAAMAV